MIKLENDMRIILTFTSLLLFTISFGQIQSNEKIDSVIIQYVPLNSHGAPNRTIDDFKHNSVMKFQMVIKNDGELNTIHELGLLKNEKSTSQRNLEIKLYIQIYREEKIIKSLIMDCVGRFFEEEKEEKIYYNTKFMEWFKKKTSQEKVICM